MIDIPLKRILKVGQSDWIRFIFPNLKEINIRELSTEKIAKIESRLDSLFEINGKFLVQIEPQGYYDISLPYRMLRYRADVYEYYTALKLPIPELYQIVVFLDKKHDNKVHRIKCSWDKEPMLDFQYKVIRMWEISRRHVLENGLTGLYSMLPLMQSEPNDTPESVVQETIKAIHSVNDTSLANDMLAVMTAICSKKYSEKFIQQLISKEEIMQSAYINSIFKEYVKEHVEKAITEGKLAGKLEGKLEGKREGKLAGKLEGKREGLQIGKLDMAKQLYSLGVPMEQIVKAAKLPKKLIHSHLIGKS